MFIEVDRHLADRVKSVYKSMTIHAARNQAVSYHSHYAGTASQRAYAAGHSTRSQLRTDIYSHRRRNRALHDQVGDDLTLSSAPATGTHTHK